MKRIKKLCIVLLASTLFVGCADEEMDYEEENEVVESSTTGQYGYCSDFNGKTAVVSIFLDDKNFSWEKNPDGPQEILDKLEVATDWLSEQSKNYGGKGSYVYDFTKNDDLYYETSTNIKCTDADAMADYLEEFIDNNIDYDAILESYNADNVLCAFYVNSNDKVSETDWTIKWEEDSENDYEYCFFYNEVEDGKLTPATIAHEFMHAFGAPDLYSADEDGYNKGITQEYVDKLENEESNDVMFTTFEQYTNEPIYDEVTNEFSELDAYYVGISDSSKVVDKWGFDASEYDN